MGTYYLCRAPRARHPYYIEGIGVRLWSIEELCYYMKENVYLLDESVLNEKLCLWIDRELGLHKLAKLLARALENQAPAEEFILPIFRECGYLSGQELTVFQEQLSQIQVEPRDVRRKMKADYLAGYGLYVRAIGEYEAILGRRGPGRLEAQFYANVCESLASAHAHLFRFEEAADCLWDSYQLLRSRKVYEKYLRLLPLFLSENQYQERLKEIRANRDVAADMKADAAAILQEGQESGAARQWEGRTAEEMAELLKEEYIRETQRG